MTADIPGGEPDGRPSESTPDGDTATMLGELGAALLDSGYAVTDAAQTLRTVGETRGRTDLTVGVLPSAIMVDDPLVRRVRMVRLLEAYRPRWPAAVTFRPAFWLLVPGSLGLVAISELTAATGQPDAQTLLSEVVATVLAISLGVQIGALVSTLMPRLPGGPVCEAA